MAVTITQPASRVVPRGTTRIAWSATYPYNAFEIQYRRIGTPTWSTSGRVTSSAAYYDWNVDGLFDGDEYCFREVLYASSALSGTTIYNGHETSPAYSIIVTPKSEIAKLRLKLGPSADQMLEIPLWNESNNPSKSKIRLNDGKDAIAPMVKYGELGASKLKIDCHYDNRSLGNLKVSGFKELGIPGNTYMQRDVRNTHYSYYNAINYSTYRVGYYISSYSYKYSTYSAGYYASGYTYRYSTYYRGYYTYTSSTATGYYRYSYYDRYYYSYQDWGSGYYRDSCVYYQHTNPTQQTGYTRYNCPTTNHPYYSYYRYCTPCYRITGSVRYNTGNGFFYYNTYGPVYYYCSNNSKLAGYYTSGGGSCYSSYTYYMPGAVSAPMYYSCYRSYSYNRGTQYSWGNTTQYWYKSYTYNGTATAQYYGYYRYQTVNYSPYYNYYRYITPNYNPYYNYYRYYAYYKHTYYTYTRSYHYA